MITNKNMSNEQLVDKLIYTTENLCEKEYVRTRDYVRLNDIREEILSRMDIVEETTLAVVIVVEDKKKCPYGRNV